MQRPPGAAARACLLTALATPRRVWPAYDIITFTLIPPKSRPFTTVFMGVCWHTYVAFVAATAKGTRATTMVAEPGA